VAGVVEVAEVEEVDLAAAVVEGMGFTVVEFDLLGSALEPNF
jgi:hypothetical protein